MPTRNVVLTDHQHRLVDTLVGEGKYQNASEVLRDGLRLVEERNAAHAARLRVWQDAARVGWADAEAGRYTDVRDDELDAFIHRLGQQTVPVG